MYIKYIIGLWLFLINRPWINGDRTLLECVLIGVALLGIIFWYANLVVIDLDHIEEDRQLGGARAVCLKVSRGRRAWLFLRMLVIPPIKMREVTKPTGEIL